MTTATPLISARGLRMTFTRAQRAPGIGGAFRHLLRPKSFLVTAVDNVTFEVDSGESVAYVGPNGAGKSTTIKLLTGILVPTSGSVSICGLNPNRDRIANAKNISVVFGQRTQLWWDIPVEESFRLLGDIYEVNRADFKRVLGELTEVLELTDLRSVPARQLSLGQRMRCDLAAALIHSPRVLYLDEPTIGLDVAVKARFREFIKYLQRERGLTLMLTSHDLGDIEELCPRLMMIDRGQIVYDGALAALTQRFGREKRISLTLDSPFEDESLAVLNALQPYGVRVSATSATAFDIHFDSHRVTALDLLRKLPGSLPLSDVTVEEPSIEAIVRQLYEGTLSFSDDTAEHPKSNLA